MGHIELNSREAFEQALAETDKYVVVYAYEGEVHPMAAKQAEVHKDDTKNYKVDVSKNKTAKEGMNLQAVPAVVIFKGGKEVKRVEGINKDNFKEIADFFESS